MHDLTNFGSNYFIEYWSAFRLFFGQSNPYEPERMLVLQNQPGWTAQNPLMIWNPPWLLLILWAFLCRDFSTAASIWLAVNTIFVFLIVLFSLDLLKSYRITCSKQLLSILRTLSFLPLCESLKIGQLVAFPGFVFIDAIWAIQQGKRLVAALFIALLSIRIHLFIPLGAILLEARKKVKPQDPACRPRGKRETLTENS